MKVDKRRRGITSLPCPQTEDGLGMPAAHEANTNRSQRTGPPRQPRIVGVDVARGIAIIGMMSVHILDPGPFPWLSWMPDDWDQLFWGRSSILFATIAGISIAFMTGGTTPVTGANLVRARMRILIRAVVIFAIGGALKIPIHNIAVILEYYAVLFVLVLPFLAWQKGRLIGLAAALTVVMPPLYIVLANLLMRDELGRISTISRLTYSGYYPAMIWIIFVLIGLGVGRLALTEARIQWRLLGAGTLLAIAGYGAGRAAERLYPQQPLAEGEAPDRFDLGAIATTEPHTGTWFEVVGSTGVALAVLAICLMVTPRARTVLFPLAAAGSMALSIYVVHVVSMVWVWPRLTLDNQYQYFLGTVVVALIASTVWSRAMGRGPLEHMLTAVSQRAATARQPEHLMATR